MIHFLSEFICSEGILAIFKLGQICLLFFSLRSGFVVVKPVGKPVVLWTRSLYLSLLFSLKTKRGPIVSEFL